MCTTPYWFKRSWCPGVLHKIRIKNRVVSLFDALHIGLVGEAKEEARDAAMNTFVCLFSIYDFCIFEYYIDYSYSSVMTLTYQSFQFCLFTWSPAYSPVHSTVCITLASREQQ